MKKKQESLQRFYTNRIEKTKRCRTIIKNIDNQEYKCAIQEVTFYGRNLNK
mgnify:CR=1 FL=1